MKRENFLITTNTGISVVKHKCNAANREVERLINEIARKEGKEYNLTASESKKDGSSYFVSGYREWTCEDGFAILFNIEKQA